MTNWSETTMQFILKSSFIFYVDILHLPLARNGCSDTPLPTLVVQIDFLELILTLHLLL